MEVQEFKSPVILQDYCLTQNKFKKRIKQVSSVIYTFEPALSGSAVLSDILSNNHPM